MLNEDEFLRLVTRELCRKTTIRRQEVYGLLERGIDGGRRLKEEQEEQELEQMNPFPEEDEQGEVEEEEDTIAIAHEMVKAAKSTAELEMIKSVIQEHILFIGLQKERLNEIAHTMGIVEVPVGQFLLKQGHLNETMYIVKQGDFSLLRVTARLITRSLTLLFTAWRSVWCL